MRYNWTVVLIRRLTWDPWNVAHVARHGVSPDEVEQVCQGTPSTYTSYMDRLLLIGPTESGRLLAVVLAPEGEGACYVITARPASRKECHLHEERQSGHRDKD